ncbi:MAG TPA: TRAP transporter small permease [Egicoccus sp.]|nr:TRAP transporter small permease [Egicoccus sp.]HSK24610.1 TRAP transporter small permease [Egicoccus sp.]
MLAVIGASCALAIVAATALNVISRGFGSPLPGMIEVSELALTLLVFLSLAYTEDEDGQVSTDIVTSRLSLARRRLVLRATSVVFAVLMGMIAWVSWGRALQSYERGEVQMGLLSWPIWPGRFAVALGFTTLMVALLLKGLTGPPTISSGSGQPNL